MTESPSEFDEWTDDLSNASGGSKSAVWLEIDWLATTQISMRIRLVWIFKNFGYEIAAAIYH